MARRRPQRYTKEGRPSPRGRHFKRRPPGGKRRTRLYKIPRGPARRAPGLPGRTFRGRQLPEWLFRKEGEWQAILPSGEAVDQVVANAAARAWLGESRITEFEAGFGSRREYDVLVLTTLEALWTGRSFGGDINEQDEDALLAFLAIVRPGSMAAYRRLVDFVRNILILPLGEVAV